MAWSMGGGFNGGAFGGGQNSGRNAGLPFAGIPSELRAGVEKVVATGTHAELMQREPRYAEVLAHLAALEGEEG
jgi:hypothetical protein